MSLAARTPLSRLQETLTRHRQFAMLAVLFLSFRVLAVPLLRPGGFITDAGPDDLYYLDFASLSSAGYTPFLDYWSDYPPVFPWLAVLAYRLSLALPAGSSPLLAFKAILHWGLTPFDLGCLILMYALAGRLYDRQHAEWVATAYTASFIPLFVLLTWFDTLALFFLLLGVWGMVSRRPALSGAGIGLGFLTKPFPAIVIPAAVHVFRRWPRRLILVGTIVVLLAAVLVPLAVLSPDYTLATLKAPLTGTAPYETVWALLDGVIDFGIVAPLDQRIDPASAVRPFESSLPWTWITLAFAGLGLFLWTRPIDWDDPRCSVAFVGLTWGLLLLYSKGFSPQWHLYTLALALLVLPGWRGVLYSVLLAVLMVWEWPVAYYIFRNASWVAVVVIALRTVATLALTLEFAARVFPARVKLARVARLSLPLAAEITLVAALALTPGMLRTYRRLQIESDSLAFVVEAIQSDATTSQVVITPDRGVVGRLAAPLREDAPVLLLPQVYGHAWEEPGMWLSEHTQGYERVWLVFSLADGGTAIGPQMQDWLDEHWCPVTETTTDDLLSVSGFTPEPASGPCPSSPALLEADDGT